MMPSCSITQPYPYELTKVFCSGYAVVRCSDSPHAMAAVRSGQGCLTLCGEKRDLWLPNFLMPNDAVAFLGEGLDQKVSCEPLLNTGKEPFPRAKRENDVTDMRSNAKRKRAR